MRRSVLVLAAFTSLTLLLSLTLDAATARAQFARGLGTVQGTVLDAHGKPVPEASVTIQTSDGLKPHATHTDSSGHYEFVRYDAGQYDLRAYSKGQFSDWSKHIVIRPKKTTDGNAARRSSPDQILLSRWSTFARTSFALLSFEASVIHVAAQPSGPLSWRGARGRSRLGWRHRLGRSRLR
jgi:hypothetical protein